ncbi:MAG: AbrB/MazE/SpoVT family DNA-binding domain-containing protein [Firmicutes bacterium]|nr:AbrB/MazE/SpoVT family DNA-binding domain-containing protein [Bacillota bacterium]
MEVSALYRAKITSKGQITVPKTIRDRLGLRQGDELVFRETAKGYLIEKRIPESPFDQHIGGVAHLKGKDPDTLLEEMRGR